MHNFYQLCLLMLALSASHSAQAQVRSQIDAILQNAPADASKARSQDKKQLAANTVALIDDLSRDRQLIQEAVANAKRKITTRDSVASVTLQAKYLTLSSAMNSFLLNLQTAQEQTGQARLLVSEAAIEIDKSFDSLKATLLQVMPKEIVIRRIRGAVLMELANQLSSPVKKREAQERSLLFIQLRDSLQFLSWDAL